MGSTLGLRSRRNGCPSNKDMESRNLLATETQKLYKELGVNPLASFIPLFVQMPVLIALYQALTRVSFLRTGHFLWLNLAETDPYYILPVLAALLGACSFCFCFDSGLCWFH